MRRAIAAFLLAAATAGWMVAAVAPADARPGGGQGYSSGSSGGGSSGSSGSSSSSDFGSSSSSRSSHVITDGNPVLFLIVFFGLIAFCGGAVLNAVFQSRQDRKDFVAARRREVDSREREARTDYLAMLRGKDPAFSLALFEDFVRALYSRAHEARHDEQALARLAPYLSPLARKTLRGERVETVIIGTLGIRGWSLDEASNRFVARAAVEANLVAGGQTLVARETWTLERSARAVTRPWEGVRTFGCPSCGAPLEQVAEGLCGSCGQEVRPGRFDWTVRTVERAREEAVGTGLTGTVEERGTDRPTVVDARLPAEKTALLGDDPQALTGLEDRLRLIFSELNAAWAAQDLKRARPYLSAGLFETLGRQLQEYVSQGLVNLVDAARIERWEMARLVRDAQYDALTLRIFGSGRDYTYRKATGETVGGDRTSDRPYSEYWTLIRGSRVRGAPRADKTCPRCAAPLSVGMEGNCEHCGALVSSGDFDWVLGGIEQDDAYKG